MASAGPWVEVAFNQWTYENKDPQAEYFILFFFNDGVSFSWQLSLRVEQRAATFITCRSKEEGKNAATSCKYCQAAEASQMNLLFIELGCLTDMKFFA